MSNKAEKRALVPKLRFPGFTGPWEEKELKPYLEAHSEKASAGTDLPVYSSTRMGLTPQKDYYDDRELVNDGEYGVVPDGFFVYRHMSDDGAFKFNINKSGRKIAVSKEYPVFTTINLHPDFLLHKINYGDDFKQFALMQKKGGTRTRLYFSTLCSWETLLPTYPEQQKIADCLASLDELITLEAQKLDTLKAHKKGLMQQLFPAEGETLPKLRFPEFWNAGEWDGDTLVQVAKFRRGSFPQPYGLPEWYDEDNGMPFVQVFDVNDDLRLKQKTKNKISKLGAEQSVFIPKDTLVVTLQGSIGRVAITQYDAYIDRTLLIFEEFFKPTEKNFFAYVIQNLFEIEKEKAPGGIIKTITKEALSDFKVKLPDLFEQQKIADCLSSIDELITAQTQKLAALKTHKKGLMQQLFPALDEVQG